MGRPASAFARDPATAQYYDDQLAAELGGQVLLDGDWFIAARSPAPAPLRS
jgi:hypothetical protein